MKKVLAVVAVIAVVCVAGTALAQPRAREEGRRVPTQMMPGQPQPMNPQFGGEGCRCGRDIDRRQGNGRMNFSPNGMPGDFGGRGHKGKFGEMMFAPDMPDEIKAKVVEAAKLRIDLKAALSKRMDFFASRGCKLSDHALNTVKCALASEQEIEAIFAARMSGNIPDEAAQDKFKTAFMMFVAHEYRTKGWVMQIHYGCRRDNNIPMFERLGPDTGYDCINNTASSAETAEFLGELQRVGDLPKTILYSLDGNDNSAIDTVCGCFQDEDIPGVSKIQHGSAWWFQDHFDGMTAHMRSLASLGYLPGFIGMLTDSRSFLSYPRHEYFRRIVCRLMGEWVRDGFFPDDMETLSGIVRGISYENAKKYFNF